MFFKCSDKFKEDALKAIDSFDQLFENCSMQNRHITLGNETITWELKTGNNEIVTKCLNTVSGELNFLYLKIRNSREYFKKSIKLVDKEAI